MNTHSLKGFTIIEVMLFLAVSGALTIGILIGSSAAIGQQRYRDSVHSFKSLLQEQYGFASNVVGSDKKKPVCSRSGDSVVFNEGSLRTWGTSECLMLGRFVLIEPTKTTAYDVVGQPGSGTTSGSDAAVLGSYSISIRTPDEFSMAWGAKVVKPKTEDGLTSSVLIVRSPLSGTILTYVQDGDRRSNIKGMISDGNMVKKEFCVDSGGLSGMRNRLAVRLKARATNQSAVEIPLESEKVCD